MNFGVKFELWWSTLLFLYQLDNLPIYFQNPWVKKYKLQLNIFLKKNFKPLSWQLAMKH